MVKGAAIEGQPLTINGQFIPNVSAWAFTGAHQGETSDLMDADDGYYLARLESLVPRAEPTVGQFQDAIRAILSRQKKLDLLMPAARQIAAAAAGGQSLAAAAAAQKATVDSTPMFTRVSPVRGVGQLNEVIGAAFGLPVGAVSQPIKIDAGVYVIRVDRRVAADRAAFEAQKKVQRDQMLQALREQKVRDYLEGLRKSADVKDNRRAVESAARRVS